MAAPTRIHPEVPGVPEPDPTDLADLADLADTVHRLRATFASGATKPLAWRQRQLTAVEALLGEREPEIVEALRADLGHDAHSAWLGDVAGTRAEAVYARRHLRRWARRRRTSLPLALLPGRGSTRYEPLGVVLVIGPWNHPVYLTLTPLVAALAAGNAVVVKPSEHAPATSALLARQLPRYLDPGAVAVCEGDASVAQALLAQGMDHAFVTGGPETGRRVMAAAARHLTPVTLELGGKSPVIVAADADLDVAARRVAWGKLLRSGQSCVAPDYVLVDAAVRDAFVEKLVAALREFRDGEPAAQRVVNRRRLEQVAALLADHGGRVVTGGGVDREALAVEPTVVVDPDPASPLMTEEILGPILPILGVGSLDDAVAFVNSRDKPLALSLFTGSADVRERVLTRTSSGAVVVNHVAVHRLGPQLPLGGVGASGTGSSHGEWGFQQLSHRKAVLVRPARPDPSLVYPPLTARKRRIMRRVF